MAEITFVDATLRDGHQSLWATRMSTAHMLPIAPLLDEAGRRAFLLHLHFLETGHLDKHP